MLACSFDEVERRVAMKGTHSVPFATERDAGQIAYSFRDAIYAEQQQESYFNIPRARFAEMLYSKGIVWAPDGDEAFDDGSYILQFDILDSVRVIAFKCGPGTYHDPATLQDVSLPAKKFYSLLQDWLAAFQAEWASMPKVAELG
jgi:hypothetical protein